MAHLRKPLAAAVALNASICVVEVAAGIGATSESLIADGVHNVSDQLGLVFLLLAFVASRGLSRNLIRTANLLNSCGLIAVCGLVTFRAITRFSAPVPIAGTIPMIVGVLAAVANWGVARFLRRGAEENPAIRLAYVHNLQDVYVSLIPVAVGALVNVTGNSILDPLAALFLGLWIAWSTVRELLAAGEQLVWPEKLDCGSHAAESIG